MDYILKPISPRRIEQTIQRLIKTCAGADSEAGKKDHTSARKQLADASKTYSSRLQKILIYQEEEIIILDPSDILYFMTEGGSVTAVTEHQKYQTKETLNNWEEKLANRNFFRCHRCYLVNLEKIEKICCMFNNTYLLRLTNHSAEIPVSRTQGKRLKELME